MHDGRRAVPGAMAMIDRSPWLTALSHAGTEELVGKKLIFVNCTHESLSGGHLELVDPDKVVLEIPPLGHAAAEEVATRLPILTELREGRLADIAPTILDVMGLEQPAEMDGKTLIVR